MFSYSDVLQRQQVIVCENNVNPNCISQLDEKSWPSLAASQAKQNKLESFHGLTGLKSPINANVVPPVTSTLAQAEVTQHVDTPTVASARKSGWKMPLGFLRGGGKYLCLKNIYIDRLIISYQCK